VDLGSLDDTDPPAIIIGAIGGQTTTHTHFTDNIVRVGLNYQFHGSDYGFRKSSGSLAMFAAILRASTPFVGLKVVSLLYR
jgi:hypothetical protein